MAVTWEITDITPIDIDKFTASITAVRDDGEGEIRTYKVPLAVIETSEQQIAAMNEILAKRAEDKAKTEAIAAFVEDRKAAGKTYLEANDNG